MPTSVNIINEPDQPYHITCVVHNLLPIFSQPEIVAIVFDSWRQLREQCGLRLYGYVIMEEHLHFLAQAEQLDICLSRFREDTAGRIITYLEEQHLERFLKRLPLDENGRLHGRSYQLWQEESELELIAGDEMIGKTLDYIHINPVKRGYVDRAEQWRYSSARNHAEKSGLLERETGAPVRKCATPVFAVDFH